MNPIIKKIVSELKAKTNPADCKGEQSFFKEPIKTHGVRAKVTDALARKYYQSIKNLDKKEIFTLSEELLKTGYNQEIRIALKWVFNLRRQYTPSDFKTFERWLNKYISNWGTDDDFCCHALGFFLTKYPQFVANTVRWAVSRNPWLRRASAVSLICSLREKKQLDKVFKVSSVLLRDPEDLVQKGYGWTLKVAGDVFPKKVFAWVMKHKNQMPRTALRYAIEKYPINYRKMAMATTT